MNKIDNIKALYEQIMNKSAFKVLVAQELGKKYGTINSHYFNGGFSIPENEQDIIIGLGQRTIRQQIARQKELV